MTRKRFLSLLLTFVMMLSLLPGRIVAAAADGWNSSYTLEGATFNLTKPYKTTYEGRSYYTSDVESRTLMFSGSNNPPEENGLNLSRNVWYTDYPHVHDLDHEPRPGETIHSAILITQGKSWPSEVEINYDMEPDKYIIKMPGYTCKIVKISAYDYSGGIYVYFSATKEETAGSDTLMGIKISATKVAGPLLPGVTHNFTWSSGENYSPFDNVNQSILKKKYDAWLSEYELFGDPESGKEYWTSFKYQIPRPHDYDLTKIKAKNCVLNIPGSSTKCTEVKYESGSDSDTLTCVFTIIYGNNMLFTRQPQGGTFLSGGQYNVTWETSFTPVVFCRYKDGVWDKTFSDPTITSDSISEVGVYTYRAYYGTWSHEYIESDEFTVRTRCVVSFRPNGGDYTPSNATTGADGKLTSLPTITRTGYSFKGWYTALTGGEKVNLNWTYESDTILYAQWEKNYYTITFNPNGGSVTPASAKTGEDGRLTSLPTPTREGYSFKNWCSQPTGGYSVGISLIYTGDTTIYAQWEKKSYTVSFDANGGSAVAPQIVEHGGYATKPDSAPTKGGWDFTGWYTDAACTTPFDFSKPIKAHTTIHAGWEPMVIQFTVGFNVDGGTPVSSQTVNEGEKVTKPADPTKDGFTFGGWFANARKTISFDFENTKIYANTIIYAKWINPSATRHYVNFMKGTRTLKQLRIYNGGYIEKPTDAEVERMEDLAGDGSVLEDWYTDSSYTTKFDFNQPITSYTEIYGKWLSGYTVTFFGFSNNFYKNVEAGKTVSPPSNLPALEGREFAGWYTEWQCINAFDFSTPIDKNIKLYAKFLPQVVYVMGGHGEDVTRALNPGEMAEELKPQDEGYQFIGWYLDADWNLPFDFTEPVYEGVKLYAAWAREIEGVSLGFEELEVGSYFGMDNNYERLILRKKDMENYELPSETISWQKDGTAATMNNSQVVEGHPYTACFTLTANPGYVFPELTTDAQKAAFLSMEGESAGLVVTYPANGAMTGDAYLTFSLNEDEDPLIAHTKLTVTLTYVPRMLNVNSVTFQANGGSGSMEVVTVGQGEKLELPACGFTAPEGYEFDCWRIGSVNYPVGAKITITEDKYVKAIWKEAKLKDENLKIAKKSLTLYDTITIEFKVEKAVIDAAYHDPYLEVTQNGASGKLSDYAVSADGSYYVFTVRIAPHQMGDAVTAVPHALNANGGDVTGAEFSYSVAEYCYNMLNKEDYQTAAYAKLRRLLVDILLYGDAAQNYAGYKTNELVGANLTAAQRAMGTDVSAQMTYQSVKEPNAATVSDEVKRASMEAAALYLEAAVNILFKYTASDLTGLRVVVTGDLAGADVLGEYATDASLIDTKGRYYVFFGGLNAGQMRKTVYATVMQGNQKVSNTYRYSIESYVASMRTEEGTTPLDKLLDAMMRYGDSAAAYAGK